MKTKKIILCADDFALNEGISKAILELLNKSCISATSCMSTSPLWPEWGPRLKALHTSIDIGIHLDLTQFKPLTAALKGPFPIAQVIFKSYSRQWPVSALEEEFRAQFHRFTEVMGFPPHFIDGHQHIHQFPQLREALLTVCKTYFKDERPPIRLINGYPFLSPVRDSPLKCLIHALGRQAFKKELDKMQWPYYPDFKGIYIFKGTPNIATLFKQLLRQIAPGGLIMCHPGHQSELSDPISRVREEEYAFLNSPQWPVMRKAESIQLCSYKETVS